MIDPGGPMRFHPTARTAGERHFESFIEEKLGFVFRGIKAPDIGVDGEIEMLDPTGTATGGLIKVQIKTVEHTPDRQRFRVDIDEKHLDYFASLTVPPIIALVCLKSDMIWWSRYSIRRNTPDRAAGSVYPLICGAIG